MQDQHFNVRLFSNPGDKVLILIEIRGQNFPIVFLLVWTFSPRLEKNNAMKCSSCIFPTTPIYVVMSENFQSSICMHGFAPIQRKRFKFLLKFDDAGISDYNLSNFKANK